MLWFDPTGTKQLIDQPLAAGWGRESEKVKHMG